MICLVEVDSDENVTVPLAVTESDPARLKAWLEKHLLESPEELDVEVVWVRNENTFGVGSFQHPVHWDISYHIYDDVEVV
ncbi:MAG TPA: hypothetical protein VGP24_12950 [Glaciihabitans sp.]|jgi:hypothetical protein|nr:hypothetical protein [Glaciihabitans sp.]